MCVQHFGVDWSIDAGTLSESGALSPYEIRHMYTVGILQGGVEVTRARRLLIYATYIFIIYSVVYILPLQEGYLYDAPYRYI